MLNSSTGVFVEVEGGTRQLDEFLRRLQEEKPRGSFIASMDVTELEPVGYRTFTILPSDGSAPKTAILLPDLATCPQCASEVTDRANRRAGYAFTNCTYCGPRFTIIRDIPYDRPNTTMSGFRMCPECREEYENPGDRRFHAQPNACPRCGPSLVLVDAHGAEQGSDHISRSAELLRSGQILALKGIGGYQLLVDARNPEAVRRLRQRKQREEKPLAVLFADLEAVREYCEVNSVEQAALLSSAAPIVLLKPDGGARLAPEVAMSSPYIGAMVAYSPLHHLLTRACGFPLVATSGNLSNEPIATENGEAHQRLGNIADVFLEHNRPIARPCDDSVTRVQGHRVSILRRARGYAPLPVLLEKEAPKVLATGAHLKNTVAIAIGRQVFLSQHVGDLETMEALDAFRRAIEDLSKLYRYSPELVACDLHPDYLSTQHAESMGLPVVHVQHHHAHVAACAAENGVRGQYLGVAWDGTGLGTDGTIWGGEFFLVDEDRFRRVAHLRPFRLPGGEKAIRECRRVAFGLLRDASCARAETFSGIDPGQSGVIAAMIDRGINSPISTSAGRLFDAVAAITGVATENRFEGQAPMLLEASIGRSTDSSVYPAPIEDGEPMLLDWRPAVVAVTDDVARGVATSDIARRFHNTLACWILETARRVGCTKVVLSGGVFQNAYLTELTVRLLTEAGFQCYTHQQVPPNDGGIALGQVVLAAQGERQ